MGIGVWDHHLDLASTVRRWSEARGLRAEARRVLEFGADEVPPFWVEMAGLGWLGLAVGEDHGGQGGGLVEAAVAMEALGESCAPGPILPTAIVAAALDRGGGDPDTIRSLVEGRRTGGFAASSDLRLVTRDGASRVEGTCRAVWGGATADVVLLPVGGPGSASTGPDPATAGVAWVVVDAEDLTVEPVTSFDPTARVAHVTVDAPLPPDRVLRPPRPDAPIRLAEILAGAMAVGVAGWCVDTAAEYATVRVQFGRPIGQFQAVKHRCADMRVALEAARAAVWDAAGVFDDADEPGWDVAQGAAAALALEAGFRCAEDCIQVLGGIGYTWEHDAHLYLKRATALRSLLPPVHDARIRVATAVADGQRRSLAIDLPDEAEPVRIRTRAFVEELRRHPTSEWRARLADAGYLAPHWPAPWGMDAGPVEQLAIDAELAAAGVRRAHLQIAGWVLPTIIGHGDAAQQERFVGPSLRGELTWCQMFSEPGAGSDLAALTTRAERVDGGWSITGEKVWTSMAQFADWGICLARTDPAAPRHEGIGCFLVDMRTPGIEVRPLRELTGTAMFNEVSLVDVVVPDDCLVGGPGDGWSCARTTLANERVSMASGSSFGPGVESLFALAADRGALGDRIVLDRLGALVVEAHAVAMLGVRATQRAIAGGGVGPEASVRKLLGVEHEQRVQEAGLDLLGADVAAADGESAVWTGGFLGNRALSIAGGTSEIQRNVIAERLLGLPKDP
jgi:alkylation response protein AidB-like acyl-CoA dehydrogenase